jgi:hypothetical protein
MADFLVHGGGCTSPAGVAWVDQNISPDATWLCGAGLRAALASNAVAPVDFDVVCHSAEKLRAHLHGIRIELEYSQGGTT